MKINKTIVASLLIAVFVTAYVVSDSKKTDIKAFEKTRQELTQKCDSLKKLNKELVDLISVTSKDSVLLQLVTSNRIHEAHVLYLKKGK